MNPKWLALPVFIVAALMLFLPAYNFELAFVLSVVGIALLLLSKERLKVIREHMKLWKKEYNNHKTGATDFCRWEDMVDNPNDRALGRVGPYLTYQWLNKEGSISRYALDSRVIDNEVEIFLKVANDTARPLSDSWFEEAVAKAARGDLEEQTYESHERWARTHGYKLVRIKERDERRYAEED